MKHEKFHYTSLQDVRQTCETLNVSLPLAEDCSGLFDKLEKNGMSFENRIVVQPMEGCDAAENGAPGELTKRRYDRFARSGAGLIWVEAIAIQKQARAKPNQLRITRENLDEFKRLTEQIRETSLQVNGFAPKLVMQAAHSGRYSNPNGYPEQIIAYNNPLFEKDAPIDPARIISDSALEQLEEDFGLAAAMAEEAGFDGVDVKCCHRYLLSEFLSAYTRPGKYGGSFENRTRLLRNSVASAQASTSRDFWVTCRMNVYDGFPYPYGFGVEEQGSLEPKLDEANRLIGILHREHGVNMIDVTIGNPYVTPHVNRPYDRGNYVPDEHPLEGVARLMECSRQIKESNPEVLVIGSGFSYLRQFSSHLAAGAVKEHWCDMAGFGRQFYAYPDFIQDLRKQGEMDPRKVCVSCGECARLLRAGACAGCVVRDSGLYRPAK